MERGLGVLIPAALFLCFSVPAMLYGFVTDNSSPNSRGLAHISGAAEMFFGVWAVLALTLFIQQALSTDIKTSDEPPA